MSIILKGMCNFESTTATPPKPEDIAPNVVSNVSFTDNGKGSITVKWTDPNDTVLDGVTIAKWYRTVLVYKKGSAPTSITDGQTVYSYTKNQYLYNGYPLTIDPDVTYYFKFFTVSDKNKTNTSDRSYTFSSAGLTVDPIFGNNSWETIVEVANSGSIPSTWKVGDEKDLVLSGNFNETVTMQIWDFDHFDKVDGTGKAKLCLGMKNLMGDRQFINKSDYSTNTNKGGWNECYMRNTVMNNIFNSMPVELRNGIKEVNTYASPGQYYNSAGQGLLSTDKVFLPGLTECHDNWPAQNKTEAGQKKFPIFSDDVSRIKKMNNGAGETNEWWTRSPYGVTSNGFCYFMYDGSSDSDVVYYTYGVCICFNI